MSELLLHIKYKKIGFVQTFTGMYIYIFINVYAYMYVNNMCIHTCICIQKNPGSLVISIFLAAKDKCLPSKLRYVAAGNNGLDLA